MTGMTDGAGPRHRVTQLNDGRDGAGVRDASTAVCVWTVRVGEARRPSHRQKAPREA